ncbi:MAG: Ca-activated chloride channel [Blastocatellia bacterium]|jgi:Mg-chelatase subunit ChlD|nr:Ca-activated chloride channel [Blastocatellia bacterium]
MAIIAIEAYHTPEITREMNIHRRTLRLFPALLLLSCVAGLCGAQDQKKISYALFLDNSGSMRSQFDQVTAIGKGVMRQIQKRGPVSIFNFTTQGRLQDARAVVTRRLEETQDQDRLEQTIDNFYVIGGQTTLLDAISVINDGFDQTADDAAERVIILITDGEDRKSQISAATLIQKLKQSKTKVFAVGMVRALSSRSKAESLLKHLTKETGGRVVFTNSDQVDLQQLISTLGIDTP